MDDNLRTGLFVLGGLVALFTFLFHTRRTTARARRDDLLKLESARQEAAARLRQRPTARYARALAQGLRRVRWFYGPKFSSQAWAVSMLLAFCYTWAVFFVLAGLGYGDGQIMDESVFPKVGNIYTQAIVGLVFGIGFSFYIAGSVASVFAVAGAYAGALAGAGAVASAFAVTVSFAFVVVGSGGHALVVAFVFGIIGVIALIIAAVRAGKIKPEKNIANSIIYIMAITVLFVVEIIYGFWFTENRQQALVIIGFFVVLPFLNGCLDLASWFVSRWLATRFLVALWKTGKEAGIAERDWPEAQRQADRRQRRRLLARMAWEGPADVAFAVLCLIVLAFFLGLVMEAVRLQVGWPGSVAAEIERAAAEPFGQGLWFTLMLFSTLVPTLLHFGLLLFAPLVFTGPPEEKKREWLNVLRLPALKEGEDKTGRFDPEDPAHQRAAAEAAKWLTGHQDGLAHLGRMAWVLALGAAVVGLFWLGFKMAETTPADALAAVALYGVELAGTLF